MERKRQRAAIAQQSLNELRLDFEERKQSLNKEINDYKSLATRTINITQKMKSMLGKQKVKNAIKKKVDDLDEPL